jgi:hypothetical protein
MKKTVHLLIFFLLIISCKEEIDYPKKEYFALSETQVSFNNSQGEQNVTILNARGATKVKVLSEGTEWCTATISGNIVTIRVTENVLARSRTAKIEVSDSEESIKLLVRQAQKYFDYIPAVRNLTAISGPGEITLKWDLPPEDNFSHVILFYKRDGIEQKIVLERGITEYTIKELKNSDGEHVFTIQSVDKENDLGAKVTISGIPNKLVAFRFEKEIGIQWVPFLLRTSDKYLTSLKIGSVEFNLNETSMLTFEIDEQLLNAYNDKNNSNLQLLPSNAYSLPSNFQYNGVEAFQDFNLEVDITKLNDQSSYALPLRLQSVASAVISEIMPSVVIEYHVEDLAGWYTVDRLPMNGEGVGQYPSDPVQRRRYIKRTGETSWETGYLFRCYVNNENHRSGSISDIQFISVNPTTKKIIIQQGNYATSVNNNSFKQNPSELHIEYLYRDWAGWWNHERMHDRSLKK